MAENKVGIAVVEQAENNSIWNTEPAVARGAVVAAVGGIGTVLVVAGVLDQTQTQVLSENLGAIAFAGFTIVPILLSAWTRLAVWSGRTAAKIALVNAAKPAGALPTLITPP